MKRIAFILQANQNDWLGGLSCLRNEQALALGRYFKAGSVEDLVKTILATIHDPAMVAKSREAAAFALSERVQQFGRVYEEIASSAVADGCPRSGS